MNYTLHQLQVFLKITQTCSITKAAEELYLTQPAVSIQLKNFQNQFDVPLTEVIGRQLYITDFGKEIASAAAAIISQVQAINYKSSMYKGQLSGRLKLSVVSTGKYVIPYFLSGFMKRHPAVELQLDVTNKSGVVESLDLNETDFSLVSVIPSQLKLESEELMQNKLFIATGSMYDIQNKTLVEIADEMPFIFREKGSATRLAMEYFLEDQGFTVRKKMELTSNEAVKQAVIAGLGCSLLPLIGLKNELVNGDLQLLKASGMPLLTKWNLVWMKNKQFSPVAEAYLNYIRENKQSIVSTHFDWFEKY